MITALTLADRTGADISLLRSDEKVLPTDVEGLFGVESPRQVKRPRPTGHGSLNDTRWGDGRLITLAFECVGTDAGDTMTQFRTITKPMLETWDYGAALLKWTEQTSGLTLQRYVKLDGDVTPHIDATTKMLVFQAQFFAEDPRAYSQTLTTVTGNTLSTSAGGLTFPMRFPFQFTPSGGGEAACTNAGNRRTPPTFRVYGQCTNPQILNVDTGERIVLTKNGVTVSAGDYLEVDVANRTVKLNGGSSYQQVVTSESTSWFELLAAGTTNIRLLADTYDSNARVDVLFRSAYA